MGMPTGFLKYKRADNTVLPPEERIRFFREFRVPLPDAERRQQGARCMDCGVPFCQSAMVLHGMVTGCPLHNLIPEWNHEVYEGHVGHALSRLLKTNNFPEFTGRVCPALCEKACIEGMDGDPVTTHENELYIIEEAFLKGLMKPRIPAVRSGKRVAVVGAGPSGLAAADQLNRRGHSVTVFERAEEIGGLLMFGIPNMKLDKSVILRRRALMEAEGVVFRCGVDIGRDLSAGELRNAFDAVVLCCGAKEPRALSVQEIYQAGGTKAKLPAGVPAAAPAGAAGQGDGKTEAEVPKSLSLVQGVYFAVDYLSAQTRALLRQESDEERGQQKEPGNEQQKAQQNELLKNAHKKAGMHGRAGKAEEGSRNLMNAAGKHVVIVGGGDTGNDCVGTAVRQGAKSVVQLEMMPEPPVERAPGNPWPEWPLVKKTDYGQQEAIAVFGSDPRIYETTVKAVGTRKDGRIRELIVSKVKFEGRRPVLLDGTEQKLRCDLLLIAAGFTGCEAYVPEAFGIQRTARGTAATAEGQHRAVPEGGNAAVHGTEVRGAEVQGDKVQEAGISESSAGSDGLQAAKAGAYGAAVFTAGDMRRGQSLVVWAIAEGRAAAREVDEYLMGYSSQNP